MHYLVKDKETGLEFEVLQTYYNTELTHQTLENGEPRYTILQTISPPPPPAPAPVSAQTTKNQITNKPRKCCGRK